MRADSDCYLCGVQKAVTIMNEYHVEMDQQVTIIRDIFAEIAKTDPEASAPQLSATFMKILSDVLKVDDFYYDAKEKYNAILMEKAPHLKQMVEQAKNPLKAAIQMAVTGNYIDFGALSDVNETQLKALLIDYQKVPIREAVLKAIRYDLDHAQKMVFITDNAGEVVLDKIFLEMVQKLYPLLEISVIIRGGAILNDVVIHDAEQVGLTQLFEVVENGTAIPGTELEKINAESRQLIDAADMIFAKGQGNFETLCGCGLNVYYLFLCKCGLFTQRFGVDRFTAVVENDAFFKAE